MTSRKKWFCLECKQDTGRMNEHYFIHTPIWLSVVGSTTGMLCVGCLEKRLGRKLTPNDFPDVTINNPKFGNKSQRLLDRLTGTTYSKTHENQSFTGKNRSVVSNA